MMVLAVVLGLLILLLVLPVGVIAQYSETGGDITACIGPIPIKIYPREEKDKHRKKDIKDEKSKKGENQEKTGKIGLGGGVPMFKELLNLGLEALGCFRRRLLMKEFSLHLTIGAQGKEPAHWGLLYGGAWAGVGNLIPLLENIFRIKKRDIQVFLDENSGENSVYGRGEFRLFLWEALYLLIYYGLRGLNIYNKRKGSNEHGTSHQ